MLGNFSADEVPIEVDGWEDAELLLGNYPDDGAAALRPWEARVYRRGGNPTSGPLVG